VRLVSGVVEGRVVKTILIIGIGAGDPEYLTIQAVNALNRVDVFFMLDKGASKGKLTALREEICRRYIKDHPHRFLDATSPEWERGTPDYRATINALNDDKRALFEHLIADGMAEGECGAFLVWGDPALYDSTMRIIGAIAEAGAHGIDYEVIPGITAPQALAARHRTTLNRIGQSVHITTGRKLAEGFPADADSVVVMLDAQSAYTRFGGQEFEIFWGAYVGTPDEILISGKLDDVAGEIERARAKARAANGWIMDTYLLRKSGIRRG
jgi:precorrin-6A synthase